MNALIIKKRRHLMKRKGLYFLIALALGGVGAVSRAGQHCRRCWQRHSSKHFDAAEWF